MKPLITCLCAATLGFAQIAAADEHASRHSKSTSGISTTTTTATASTTGTVHPGRLLASNCFQCHGTEGRAIGGIDSLAGKSASDIYGDVREMRAKPAGENIMYVHARGYTDQELRLIADYFASLPR